MDCPEPGQCISVSATAVSRHLMFLVVAHSPTTTTRASISGGPSDSDAMAGWRVSSEEADRYDA